MSGIAVGTRLRVTLPCNCQYNPPVPNPRATYVFMPTGSNGGCVTYASPASTTPAPGRRHRRITRSSSGPAAAATTSAATATTPAATAANQGRGTYRGRGRAEAQAGGEPRADRCGGRLLRPRRRRRRRGGRRRTAKKAKRSGNGRGTGRRRLFRTGAEGGRRRAAPRAARRDHLYRPVSKRVAQHQTRALDALIAFLETAPPGNASTFERIRDYLDQGADVSVRQGLQMPLRIKPRGRQESGQMLGDPPQGLAGRQGVTA